MSVSVQDLSCLAAPKLVIFSYKCNYHSSSHFFYQDVVEIKCMSCCVYKIDTAKGHKKFTLYSVHFETFCVLFFN